MYIVAIIADIFSLIPIVNIVTDFIAAVLLGIIGSATGVSLYSSDRIGGTLLAILIEAVPGLSIIPTWTIRVYFAKKAAQQQGSV